jgi:hypothetical protein
VPGVGRRIEPPLVQDETNTGLARSFDYQRAQINADEDVVQATTSKSELPV